LTTLSIERIRASVDLKILIKILKRRKNIFFFQKEDLVKNCFFKQNKKIWLKFKKIVFKNK
jgi:hypothetical protein